MLPVDPSTTTSSKSRTNSGGPAYGPDTPIQYVKGVGPKLGALLKSRGIATVGDLLYFFPRQYEDRTKMARVADLREGEKATVSLRVLDLKRIPIRKLGRNIMEVRCTDDSGNLSLKWFHVPKGMDARFKPGTQFVATGTVKTYLGKKEIIHPEISWGVTSSAGGDAGDPHVGRVIPIYTEIEGIPTRFLRKILWEAIEKFGRALTEDLPQKFVKTHDLPSLARSVREIHFPTGDGEEIQKLLDFATSYHHRLIYEEFFKFEYLVLKQRLKMERAAAPTFGDETGLRALEELENALPFRLTRDQKRAIEEIVRDLSQPHPMNRLIQGDVGSGKTAVAFLTAGLVLAQEGQVALMAPTEILAEQHFKNALKLFGTKLKTGLLTGKTTASERAALLPRLAAGEPLLLIGTHALIEDSVQFKKLSFIIIDEQHRFGVEQRRTLRKKGTRMDAVTGKALLPHNLVLSATPIPRTLALTAYGDLSQTLIRELPPGRSPIETKVLRSKTERGMAYQKIREEISRGHQAYFIFPLVHESEAEGFTELKSAVAESDRLAKEVFPEFKIGLLHGQMRPEEKAQVMSDYLSKKFHILVSTTVVEVGVDVPNATVMAIEHAERFGLSQLHQLRGRVGRGSSQSYCFLFTHQNTAENTTQRLEVLEETTDGFKIAEADLEMRGPGEFLGTRQAGSLPFHLANIVRDRDWLLKARDDAYSLLREDPDLIRSENVSLKYFFEREGRAQFERLKTS